MTRSVSNPSSWPRLMCAENAAAFLGEKSVRAFRRRVGKIYSLPTRVPGRGDVWDREDLEQDAARNTITHMFNYCANVLEDGTKVFLNNFRVFPGKNDIWTWFMERAGVTVTEM